MAASSAATCCLSMMNLSLPTRLRDAAPFCTTGFNNTVPALRSSGSGFSLDSGNSRHSYGAEQAARPAVMVAAAAASGSASPAASKKARNIYEEDAKVIQVHTIKEYEDALVAAKNKLVVVEYAASTSPKSRKIYPAMVDLSRTCPDTVFLLVMGDESGETRQLCEKLKIEKVPHFVFYKNQEIIHEEEGIGPDELLGDVLYYGDPDAPIRQLHSKKELEDLMDEHSDDGKLIVLDVGLKHCGPCVKVYPTFVKLSKKMSDTSVFARINGDENDELMDLLRQMDVVEVPTFVFIRNKEVCGRYVGSGKGELIGEILRYQGVRVTY